MSKYGKVQNKYLTGNACSTTRETLTNLQRQPRSEPPKNEMWVLRVPSQPNCPHLSRRIVIRHVCQHGRVFLARTRLSQVRLPGVEAVRVSHGGRNHAAESRVAGK